MQKENKDFDVAFNSMLQSPAIKHYSFDTYVKKRAGEKSNHLAAGFVYDKENDESKVDK